MAEEDTGVPAPTSGISFHIDSVPEVITLPEGHDKTKLNIIYPLIPPYAFAHIYWDPANNEIRYEVEEPKLDEHEAHILNVVEKGIEELINISFINVKRTDVVIVYLEKNIAVLLAELGIKVSEETFQKIMYYIYRNFVGLNEIEPLMKDYFIEDIECNGVNAPIYIVHRKYRNIKTNIIFKNVQALSSFVEKLAQKSGKYISYAHPIVDGRLPDGSRVNATYTQDISTRGPTFCFKDGYVQLNNGLIKNIKELFEETKKIYGSKVEEGNEIVEVNNLGLCGVDEKDLEQKDAKITSIIKVKPPAKLVKILFEDGGKVEVTLNHLFHVADGSLKTLEAKDLKPHMLVPIPKLINVNGYKQKIDVYTLLKDFSYSQKICIVNTEKIKEIVQDEIQIHMSNGKYRSILSQRYGVGDTYFYEIISRGNSISFEILDEICKERNTSFAEIGELGVSVYGGGTKNKTKTVKVPQEIDEDLAYLTGALISDGHVSKEYVDFSSYEEGFRNAIKRRLISVFGRCDSYYNGNRIYLCNLFVVYLFNKVFGIPIGKKAYKVKVPDIIAKSSKKEVAAFIKGLFDGDGTTKGGLSYKTYSRCLAEELTYLLARFNIYSYIKNDAKEYRINIPSPYYKQYKECIGFESLTKKNELDTLIARQISHKTEIRHTRVPADPFLAIINKLQMSKNKLMKECQVSYRRFYYSTFSRTFAKKLLLEIEKHERKHLVQKEIEYIKWLIGSEQEFVKIEDVQIIENSDTVYDITLEPCKFFIAGNKPMNMFDTVRKFTAEPYSPVKLLQLKTVSPEMLAYLWLVIEHEANFLVIGGTGSGKTSLLNSLAFFIPPEARVVSIEDTHELSIMHENWLPSVAREATGVGAEGNVGEVDLFALLKASFRQRPDYVIVGEIRGKEAYVLFQGAASGHAVACTLHAEDVDTMIKRLENEPINLPGTLLETIDIVCIMGQVHVQGEEVRRVKAVVEIVSVSDKGEAITNTPFVWDPKTDSFFFKIESVMFNKLVQEFGLSPDYLQREFSRRTKLFIELYKRNITDYKEVQKIINAYYTAPQEIIRKFNL